MTLSKGSIVAVKLKDGTTVNATITKIGPWKKNPKITIVDWNSLDLKLSGTNLPEHCTIIPDPAAIPDPLIADWSLGPTKKGPAMMEGYYFSSILYYKGKKVGKIVDRGDGGMNDVEAPSTIANQFTHDILAWSNKYSLSEHGDEIAEWWTWWEGYRPTGMDAPTYFKKRKEEMDKMLSKSAT